MPALARADDDVAQSYRWGSVLDRATFATYERILAYDVMQKIGISIVMIVRLSPAVLDELTAGICVVCEGGAADIGYVR